MWPFKRKPKIVVPDTVESAMRIDFDRDSIPLDDPEDPTSLLIQLTMRDCNESDGHPGAVVMSENPKTGWWCVTVGGVEYEGASQMEALMKATLKDETKGNA